MDKMASAFLVKRKTLRRAVSTFYNNIIDLAGLAAYIIYKQNNLTKKPTRAERS